MELFVEEASRESSRRVGSRDLVAHAAANRTYFAELWSIRKQLLPIERRVIGQIPRKNISNHNLCFSLISSISNSWIRLKTRRNNDNNTFPRLPSRISISIFWPVCRDSRAIGHQYSLSGRCIIQARPAHEGPSKVDKCVRRGRRRSRRSRSIIRLAHFHAARSNRTRDQIIGRRKPIDSIRADPIGERKRFSYESRDDTRIAYTFNTRTI